MFAGSHLLTMDDKGRLAIPARFRQQLADEFGLQVFITRAYEPCLEIYPATVFRELADQIQAMAPGAARDKLKHVFIGNAVETEIDKQGRVLLPQLLRKFARLDGSAMLVGQINRFDVWAEDLWSEKFGDGAAAAEELAAAFALLRR